jgi:tryptophanyl-tRNA synthetase
MQEQTALVPGTDGQKMSKSADNAIDLFATDEEVKRRIMSIKTDSAAIDAPKSTTSALYDLLKIMAPAQDFPHIDESWRSGGKGYAEYKRLLLDVFHATFDAARERRKQLLAAPDEVEQILVQGARRAREMAAPVMRRVRRAVGLPEAGA